VKKQLPLTPVLAVALVILVAVAWFALISPKRARGAALDEEKAELQSKIALATRPKTDEDQPPPVEIDVADLFRLAKAMPDRDDMSGVLLELDAVSTSAGVAFLSIQPGSAVTYPGYYAVPVTLTFSGNYYDLTDFLFRLRNLVTVRDGVLEARGRLYTLDSLEFHESEEVSFPAIEAVLTVSAYSFGVPTTPGVPPPATTTGATTTGETGTGATTTGATTTTESGSGEQNAAGGTP
jgi:Tfp pilus assembly protein PilO